MFIAGDFTVRGPSRGAVDVCVVRAGRGNWNSSPMSDQQNTYLIPARKVITTCWNIKPDGLPSSSGSWKYQQEKFRVWENPLSLVRECGKKKKTRKKKPNKLLSHWLIFGLRDIDSFLWYVFWLFFSGFYCLRGSGYPQLCDAGSYCDQNGLEVPAGHCAAGYYCREGSSEAHATPCPRGRYCPLGTPLPLPCPPGTMKSGPECSFWFFCHRLVIIRSISLAI